MSMTKAERQQLKKLPIQGYCDWKNIPYSKSTPGELRMVDHDSLVVRTQKNLFVWNSTGIRGDLVDFIHYYELGKNDSDSKGEAIRHQLAYARYVKGADIDVDKLYQNNQPAYQFDYKKVYRTKETNVAKDYLVHQRQLDPKFVDRLIQRGEVAQGSKYHENDKLHQNPVIFPWKDVNGKIVGADRQGTETDFEHYAKRGTSKKIARGSDVTTGYNLSFGKGDQTLVLFESPIDLLSYAQQNHQELIQNNATLLSVSGTDAKRGLHYLNAAITEKNAQFKHLIVAFDNDRAGFQAADFYERHPLQNLNTQQAITVERQIPLKGKDWNEQLKAGVTGKQSMTMADSTKRLDALEELAAQESQANPFDVKDNHVSAIPAKRTEPTSSSKKSVKRTKAQRRQENAQKNKAIMAEAVAKVKQYHDDPKALKELLDFTATGLNYSARNSMLIHLQREDATLVKGYNQWHANGIQVNKGEKGIKIYGAPVDLKTIIKPNGEKVFWRDATPEQQALANNNQLEVKTIKHYPIETVFDVKQTNATQKQLPKLLPNRPIDLATDNSPIHLDNAYKALLNYAKQMKVPVYDQGADEILAKERMSWQGQAKGAFRQSKSDPTNKHILLRSDLTPTDKIQTLAHEVAHAKLHGLQSKNNWSTEIKETQAELSSYVVTKSLGIEPGEQSIRYIAGWSDKLKKLAGADTGKILNQALQASTDVTSYLSKNLNLGVKRQVTTKKFQSNDQLAVVQESAQNTNQMTNTMRR